MTRETQLTQEVWLIEDGFWGSFFAVLLVVLGLIALITLTAVR